MKEKEMMLVVFDYFREFGFSDIATNVKINETACDMVISYEGKAQIVIEVLSNIKRLKQVINNNDLLFEPIINLLQSKAYAMSAHYYVFTNGEEYIWFQNDELGSPQNISAPVNRLGKHGNVNVEFNREKLINYLQRIHETYFYEKRSSLEFLKLILFKIMVESELLKKEDLFNSNFKLDYYHFNSSDLYISRQNKDIYIDVYSRLEQVKFSSIQATDLFVALDSIFIPDRHSGEIVMTRWLSDLLIKISGVKSDSSIWDITSSGGYITSAARITYPDIETLNFCVSEKSAILATIHEIVTGGDIRNIFVSDVRHITKNSEQNKPSHIVCAPHFGVLSPELKFMSLKGATRFEEFCIERALDLVTEEGKVTMLLPESFFFSGGKRQLFRRRLLEQIKINAIISLPLGVIKNHPNVKVCMFMFEKKKPISNYEIFMYNLNIESTNPALFSINDNYYLNKIVEEFTKQTNDFEKIGWTVWSDYLNESNWSPYHYEASQVGAEYNVLEYPVTTLKNVTLKIQRGTSLKLEKAGEIPVISPGVIRTSELLLDKLDFTTDEKIHKRRIYAHSNNIVMNNIGTHIGSSALVPPELNETICSQHVIVIKGNDSIILPQFLVIALNSEYVQMQISKNATGTVMPSISITQLENIKIPFPDLSRQKALIEHVYGIEKKMKELNIQLNILAHERKKIIGNFGFGGM